MVSLATPEAAGTFSSFTAAFFAAAFLAATFFFRLLDELDVGCFLLSVNHWLGYRLGYLLHSLLGWFDGVLAERHNHAASSVIEVKVMPAASAPKELASECLAHLAGGRLFSCAVLAFYGALRDIKNVFALQHRHCAADHSEVNVWELAADLVCEAKFASGAGFSVEAKCLQHFQLKLSEFCAVAASCDCELLVLECDC